MRKVDQQQSKKRARLRKTTKVRRHRGRGLRAAMEQQQRAAEDRVLTRAKRSVDRSRAEGRRVELDA